MEKTPRITSNLLTVHLKEIRDKLITLYNFNHIWNIQIIPPPEWQMTPNRMDGSFYMPTIVAQKIIRAEKGAFVMEYQTKPAMTLAEFTEKAAAFQDEDDTSDINFENMYWKDIRSRANQQPDAPSPLYGIDTEVSLFPDKCTTWNLNKIDGKDSIIHNLDVDMPGILTPFLNNGTRNTSFGWHVEDSNLLSVSILQEGKPKFWYCVPNTEGSKLEAFSREATKQYLCKLLIRHKLILIPPSVLKKNGIKFGKVIGLLFLINRIWKFGVNAIEKLNMVKKCG